MPEQLTAQESIPLTLLYEAEDCRIEGRVRFQKMVFLVQELLEEMEEDYDLYEFIRYDYGPFAKQLLDDLERFERLDLVDIDQKQLYRGGTRYDHELTRKGVNSVENLLETSGSPALDAVHEAAQDVIEEWDDESMWDLLDHIYEQHPKYKEKSVLY